jgi:hypothetical protein
MTLVYQGEDDEDPHKSLDDLRRGQARNCDGKHGLHKSCGAKQLAGTVVYIRNAEQASSAGGCHGRRRLGRNWGQTKVVA